MTENLTLQARLGSTWRDAASLVVDAARPWVQVTYEVDYVYDVEAMSSWPESLRAVSLRWPLDLAPRSFEHWPALLEDLMPGGAARRWWVRHLGLGRRPEHEQRLVLLREASMAPVGHLRIKESLKHAAVSAESERITFPIESVVNREHGFLDYAQLQGASVGGATGAAGEAPKFLLRLRGNEVWIDTRQEDESEDRACLVKFPRRTRLSRDGDQLVETAQDRLVLESEFVYYQALHALGVDTIEVSGASLRHGVSGQPSLWMPRFDVVRRGGETLRLGVESLYALTDKPAGASADHQEYLDALYRCLIDGEFLDPPPPRRRRARARTERGTTLVFEYVRRDLLNVLFGNPDNHGRNMAVLKSPEGCWLAPVYDFAPMAMDLDGVTRSTRWRAPGLETPGGIDWLGVCRAQAHLAEPDEVWSRLQAFAGSLVDLDERLEALGLPRETLEFAPIGLRATHDKLRAWGLST